MRYLVTGGAGFIGSHLADALARDGHELIIFDDLSTGKRDYVSAKSCLVVDDVSRAGVFDSLLAGVDGCFHLAAIASVVRSNQEWLRTHQVNAGGTVNLFDAIARSGRKIPVVFASSAAVYGATHAAALSEDAPLKPLSAYGADKLACEHAGYIAAHNHGIPNIGLRFFNVYGPRQDPLSPYSGVISIFAGRILKKLPLVIHGDGKQTRDFIYVEDVVAGTRLTMDTLQKNTIRHAVYNLCTGHATSIGQLAEMMGKTSEYGPPRSGDARDAIGDPTKAKSELGFSAKTPLAVGLKHTLEWLSR